MRKFWAAFATLILALSIAGPVTAAKPIVSHILPPGDGGSYYFPGRVLRDEGNGNSSLCRVAAYGRVNGKIVIFLAHHCRSWDNAAGDTVDYAGGPARTNGGVRIGVWGPNIASVDNNDLTYITLDAAWVPSVASGMLNEIYRGNVTGNDTWTMTSQPTAAGDGCQNFAVVRNVYENWQRYTTTTTAYRTGQTTGAAGPNGCGSDGGDIQTNLDWHNGVCCTSGTPVVSQLDPTTLTGIMTGEVGGRLYFETFAEGLYDLDAYWDVNGSNLGAKLCIDNDC